MSWNLTTSGAAISKAGLNANSNVIISGAVMGKWCDDSEAKVCAETRRDWVSLSASTLANFAGALSDAVSSDIAIKIINYDMSGYTSRAEAQTMLNVNKDMYKECINILKEEKNKEKMIS